MIWTIQQVAIFTWFAAVDAVTSLVVRARAGCGKTTTIVEGIKRYVAACVATGRPVRVLATSFGKKITSELETRLAGIAGVEVKSLNSLGFRFVREAVRGVKLDAATRKYDLAKRIEPKASQAAIQIIAGLHTKAREILPLATCGDDLIELAERFGFVPTTEIEAEGWDQLGLCEAAYDCMVLASKEYRVIDFADQTYLPLRNGWTYPIYDRVIVDETQDMTEAQLMLAMRSCKPSGKFCIVGDDQQAIYGFRGADVNGIDRLKTELQATELGLTVTYRCPSKIVTMAQAFVPDFTAAPGCPEGEISDLKIDIDGMLDAVVPGDFILSRTNAPLVSLCLSLLKRGKRAFVAGRDIGASLAAIVRKLKLNDVSELSVKLGAWSAAQYAKIEKDKRAIDGDWSDAQYERIDDQTGAIMMFAKDALTVSEILGRIAGMFDEEKDVKTPSIMLSTVHKAKGLEADNVYLCEGTFKYRCEEDTRVRYVAITRAKRLLAMVRGFEKNEEQLAA